MRGTALFISGLICLIWAPLTALATTYYVNPGQSIQDAIDSSTHGDTIIVSPGIYYENIFFDGKNLKASAGHQSAELTRREMDIMIYLHRHQDRIVSKKELLTEVWHYADADIETRTVDIHMLKLRKKVAALIGDDNYRRSFLENVSLHREIVTELENSEVAENKAATQRRPNQL